MPPWEKYQKQQAGPWEKYARKEEPRPAISGSSYVPFVDDEGMRMPAQRIGFDPGVGKIGAPPPEALRAASIGAFTPDEAPEYARSTGQAMKEAVATLPLIPIGGKAFSAPSLLGKMGRGAVAGGASGFLYGAGTGEGGIEDRLQRGAEIGGAGAAVGAVAPPLIEGASALARGIGSKAAPVVQRMFGGAKAAQGTYRDQAARKVTETIMQQFPDMPPEQAVRNAQRVVQRYGPKAALMDAGELTRELAKTTVRQGGTPGMQVERFVRQRQEGQLVPSGQVRGGQYERVSGVLDDAESNRLRAVQDKLFKQRSAAGRKAFEEALDTGPIYSDRLKQFIDDPITSGGFKRGLELERLDALANNRPFDPYKYGVTGFNEAGDPVLGKVPTMRTYQAMKEGLDGIVNESVDQFGRLTKRGVAVARVRDELVKELDAFNPAYAAARKAWAGPTQRLNASREGFRFMSKAEFANPDEMAARLAKMSKPEKEAFRVGAAQALKDMAGEVGSTNDIVSRMWNKANLRGRLKLAFGDAKTFRKIVHGLMSEKEMFKAYSAVTRGSDTAKNFASMQRTGVDAGDMAGAAFDAKTGNVPGLAMRGLRALQPRGILGPPEPVRGEIAGLLTSQDIAPILKAAERIGLSQAQRRALEQMLLAGQGQASQNPGLLP